MNKTKKLMVGIVASISTIGLSACGEVELPPEPTDTNCDDWDWDEENGVYVCDDDSSLYYRSYYYGGKFFTKKSSLLKNSNYKSYIKSSKFKGSSGFGSGSKVFGG